MLKVERESGLEIEKGYVLGLGAGAGAGAGGGWKTFSLL